MQWGCEDLPCLETERQKPILRSVTADTIAEVNEWTVLPTPIFPDLVNRGSILIRRSGPIHRFVDWLMPIEV